MTQPPNNSETPTIDPLLTGELLTIQEAADYAGLSKHSIQAYIRNGRLKAVRRGWMWFTTRAAVDAYLTSRDLNSIPKKYRQSP